MQENQDTAVNEIEPAKMTVRKSFLGAGLACLLAVSAFFSGVHVGSASLAGKPMEAGLFSFWNSKPKVAADVDLTEFWKVWNLLDEKFVSSSSTEKVSKQEKLEGAIAGLVRSYGDPYTVFFKPTDASSFQDEISGNFGGVGMEVGQRNSLITVIAPLPRTPAEAAGIVAKDVIVKIDGKVTEGMDVDEAVRLIRGEVGTKVKLTIYREGEVSMLEKEVTRAKIDIPTTATEKKGDVFIISLYSFNAVSEQKMNEALDEFVKSGAEKLILDVRGNPGGFLQSAVAITSRFVEGGKVIVSENFGSGKQGDVYRSSGKTLGEKMPKEMIVLIDGGSASASEILAGALQEHGVAKLLGAQSYGKGSVQELVELDSGSSLKVTIARWFTPNGVSISLAGLTPDIIVPRTPQQVIDKVDPQMEAALRWLGGDRTMPKIGTTTPKQ